MTPEKQHFQENLGLNNYTPEQLEKIKTELKEKIDTLKADGSFSGEDLKELVDLLDDKTILSPTEAELKAHLETLQDLNNQIDFLIALVEVGGENTEVPAKTENVSEGENVISENNEENMEDGEVVEGGEGESENVEEKGENIEIGKIKEITGDSDEIKNLINNKSEIIKNKEDLKNIEELIHVLREVHRIRNNPNIDGSKEENFKLIEDNFSNIKSILNNIISGNKITKSQVLEIEIYAKKIEERIGNSSDRFINNGNTLLFKKISDIKNIDEAIAILNYTNRSFEEITSNNIIGFNINESLKTINGSVGIYDFQDNLVKKIKSLDINFEKNFMLSFEEGKGLVIKEKINNENSESNENNKKLELSQEVKKLLNNKKNEEFKNIKKRAEEGINKLLNENSSKEDFQLFISIADNIDDNQINLIKKLNKDKEKYFINIENVNSKILGKLLENNIDVNFSHIENVKINKYFMDNLGENKKDFLEKYINYINKKEDSDEEYDDYVKIEDNKKIFSKIINYLDIETIKTILPTGNNLEKELEKTTNGEGNRNIYYIINDENFRKEFGEILGLKIKDNNDSENKTYNYTYEEVVKYNFKNLDLLDSIGIVKFLKSSEDKSKNNEIIKKLIDIDWTNFSGAFIINNLEDIIKNSESALVLVKGIIEKDKPLFGDLKSNIKNDPVFIKEVINSLNIKKDNIHYFDDLLNLTYDVNTTNYILNNIKTKFNLKDNFFYDGSLEKIIGEKAYRDLNIFILRRLDDENLDYNLKTYVINNYLKKEVEREILENINNEGLQSKLEGLQSKLEGLQSKLEGLQSKYRDILDDKKIKEIFNKFKNNEVIKISDIVEILIRDINLNEKTKKRITELLKEIIGNVNEKNEETRKENKENLKSYEENLKSYEIDIGEFKTFFKNEKQKNKNTEQIIVEFIKDKNFHIEEEKQKVIEELNKYIVLLENSDELNKVIDENKKIENNLDSYIDYKSSGHTGTFEEYAKENKIALKDENGNIINAKEIGLEKNDGFHFKDGIVFSSEYAINIEKGELISKNGQKIELSNSEKEMVKSNPELAKNIINLYSSLRKVGLDKLWNFRENIFKSIENISNNTFERDDGNYFDERETKILLNSILVSIGEEPVKTSLNMESFLTQIENKNGKQITGGEKQINNYGETALEQKFIEKFVPRGDMIGFRQAEFEASLK